ncbi:MAG TPA: YicC/YloC family endoribonuclease [Patescibacteria group bacterium]|nr:YicC/YloC family endoribonuclease [Patescibacteria group bacterium]
MTGFGRAEASGESIAVTVEARSVNHRHLDVALRLPRTFAALELDARRLVQSRLERGRVDVNVQLTPLGGGAAQRVQVDAALAREYVTRARALAMELGLEGAPNLTWVLERPGVVRLEEPEPVEPVAPWPLLADALGRALDELVARRTAEGERLVEGLRTLHAELTTTVAAVAARAPATAARREERLRERLRALLAETAIDALPSVGQEARIVTEAAIWADKSDVTEELARLRAHLAEFTLLLDKGGPVGRPLDFLIQELNREVNTVASKADDLEMSQAALAAKSVLEKIREQVQNLE